MQNNEQLEFLIKYLIDENSEYFDIKIPHNRNEQFKLFRSLVNVRPPNPVSEQFLTIQNEYLRKCLTEKGITEINNLQPITNNLYLWQGDITTLQVDAIVNAANSQMLGCFVPCHSCIDNVIHTFSGVQLRLACADIMNKQGHNEEIGNAKITPAFNLPCKYVLHTVGPMIENNLTQNDSNLLASCYKACLKLAVENGIKSIAFCCISTGIFHFPNTQAANIAVETVKTELERINSSMKVVFNVFKDVDYGIYKQLLTTN
jgi:O-acetyl-ADP-ribose deacetylase (regulator of RNase III)